MSFKDIETVLSKISSLTTTISFMLWMVHQNAKNVARIYKRISTSRMSASVVQQIKVWDPGLGLVCDQGLRPKSRFRPIILSHWQTKKVIILSVFIDWLICYFCAFGPWLKLTDWQTEGRQWLTDCWTCTAFCRDSFSLLRQLCAVGHGIFLYGRCKQLFVSELNNSYFSRHLY